MLSRRLLLAAAAFATLATSASAAQRQPYSEAAFLAAQAAGEPILVHVTAVWCGTCKAQKPKVAALADRPEYKNLHIFDVDFDTQADALKRLNVRQQSVLISFKGKTETSRSAGQTALEKIQDQFNKAL
jgi:thiol-disulfide isomerase/thioredoxin